MEEQIKDISKDSKGIKKLIIEYKDFLSIIGGGVALMYPMANIIHKITYRNKCEKFYGIPSKYFDSSIDNKVLYLSCVILVLAICIIPIYIKNRESGNEKLSKIYRGYSIFLSVTIGIEIGLFNYDNFCEIVNHLSSKYYLCYIFDYWLDSYTNGIVIFVVLAGVISVLGVTLLDKAISVKKTFIKKIFLGVIQVSLLVSLALVMFGTMIKLSTSIEDKTKYEFLIGEDEYVILSEYDNKLLIVPFFTDETGRYVFITDEYRFHAPYEDVYKYINIGRTPLIQKDCN